MDEQQFVQLLEGVLAPDTERVKASTANLRKNYYTSPASLSLLLHILTSYDSQQLRQLAAVEARSLVPKHWLTLPESQKPQIRESLLQSALNEQSILVRHSIARVISAIAKIDLEDGVWGDLPGFLQRAATSQTAAHREVAIYILFTLMETMADGFVEKFDELFTLFGHTIKDPESAEVRINTMLALSKIAMVLDADDNPKALTGFRSLLPNMVAVLKDAVDARDEDRTMQAFEVFQTLLGCDAQLLATHFKDLVFFMLELASETQLPDESRTQALSFLIQCVKFRKLKVQGMKAGQQLTLKSLQIVTELSDEEDDEDEITPARTALGLLDQLASSLPPSQVIVPLLQGLGPYVNSPDPGFRRAGVLALGACVEGAPDFIQTQLHEIMPVVLRLLQDPEIKVRRATLSAVALLADDLAEELGKEHENLIPALVTNLDQAMAAASDDSKASLDIIKASCAAIDSVIDGIEEEDVVRYVQELAPRLSQLFSHPDFKVKAAAAGALGSVAAASGQAFIAFFEQTINTLAEYATIKDSEEELELRGVVCEAMGNIASAVGREPFRPYVQPLMQASEEALHLGDSRLKETSYILWSTMAKVYEDEFAPFLRGVVQGLFQSLEQEEADLEVELGEEAQELLGSEITIAGKKVKVASAEDAAGRSTLGRVTSADDDDDDVADVGEDDDDDAWDDLGAVTAVALEKEIAIEVFGDILTHTKDKFLPYLQKTIEEVLPLVEHNYEGVRKAAISTSWRAYACLWGIEEPKMGKWQPGLPLKIQPTDVLTKLGGMVMTATLAVWPDEIDRSTVTDINRNLSAILKTCGPAILNNPEVIHQITTNLVATITKQHPCQQDLGDEAEEELLEESSEYDWLVIDTALDVVVGLATALGPTFGELWKLFEKTILKYASAPEAIERRTAVGAIAECIASMHEAVTPYTATLMKILLHRLSDEDAETKSNAAFAIGLLCEHSGNDNEVLKSYNAILGKLEPLLTTQEARLQDNSAGCVSRMILKHQDHVPLEEVLPALVSLLPLKMDYEENEPLYKMIVKLYQTGNPTMRSLTRQLVPVLAQVLSPPEDQLTAETRGLVVELVKYLHSQEPGLVQSHETLVAAAQS